MRKRSAGTYRRGIAWNRVRAARIRMRYRLRLPDAIQAATAVAVRAWALVTHDPDLAGIEAIRIWGVGSWA